MRLNGKEVQFVMSSTFADLFQGLEAMLYTNLATKILPKYPVDMLVFECKPDSRTETGYIQQIRLAGYYMTGENEGTLEEERVVWKDASLKTPTFWLKLDDYGDRLVATWLMPEDY